jgi:hypothetical protein
MSKHARTLVAGRSQTTALLTRLIEMPDLAKRIRSLDDGAFSALVRRVGVEDAGELIALASTEQLTAAFDEDLFVNDAPGERERFDPDQFVTWLEVLLEAGEAVAARQISKLSEDFVVVALTSIAIVLDHDALAMRLAATDDDARLADKALQSALTEELDGYLLVAKRHSGWDALLALILALDRDDRAFVESILDRAATLGAVYVEEPDELITALSAEASLAEDVEAERQARRSAKGYIDPQDARAFLTLARKPLENNNTARDAITAAYFRELDTPKVARTPHDADRDGSREKTPLEALLADVAPQKPAALLADGAPRGAPTRRSRWAAFTQALADLQTAGDSGGQPSFGDRMAELAFLANAIKAGASLDGQRVGVASAVETAVATCALGAEIVARRQRASSLGAATVRELTAVLEANRADLLFRIGSSHLASESARTKRYGLIARSELSDVIAKLR